MNSQDDTIKVPKAFIVGDIHGCLTAFKQLIKDIDRSKTRIILVGDLIDRGEDSRGVINFVRDNNIECVLGNHELMLLECEHLIQELSEDKDNVLAYMRVSGSDWFNNGGKDVFFSYKGDYKALLKDLELIKTFPKSIATGIYKGSRELVVSHTYTSNLHPKTPTSTFVWSRDCPTKDVNPAIFNVYGHTPTSFVYNLKHIPVINTNIGIANIDTGAPYNTSDRGYLTGLFFPSLEYKQVKVHND